MNSENRVPTYGAVVSSMDYDIRLKRRQWFKKHKSKLILGCAVLLVAAAIVVFTLI